MDIGKVYDSHNPGFPAYLSDTTYFLCGTEILIKSRDPISVGKHFNIRNSKYLLKVTSKAIPISIARIFRYVHKFCSYILINLCL